MSPCRSHAKDTSQMLHGNLILTAVFLDFQYINRSCAKSETDLGHARKSVTGLFMEY